LEDLFELPLQSEIFRALQKFFQELAARLQENQELQSLVTDEKEWLDRAQALLTNYFSIEKPHTFESTYREIHLERDLTDEIISHGYVDRIGYRSHR
jgi:putative RecB family exonuclease